MKHDNPSILNSPGENRLARRLKNLEQQVADLTAAMEIHGIRIVKCDFCGQIMDSQNLYCESNQLCGVNASGPGGVVLREGKYKRYYCAEHLREAYEDIMDWGDRDGGRAAFTLASWLLKWRTKRTPEYTSCMIQFPEIKDKMLFLMP